VSVCFCKLRKPSLAYNYSRTRPGQPGRRLDLRVGGIGKLLELPTLEIPQIGLPNGPEGLVHDSFTFARISSSVSAMIT